MNTVKTFIVFAAFLVMTASIVNLYFNMKSEIAHPLWGTYIELGAMAILLLTLFFCNFQERKIQKLKKALEEAQNTPPPETPQQTNSPEETKPEIKGDIEM